MDYKKPDEKSFDGSGVDKYFADEFGQTGKLNFASPKQKEIENQRYKQDCRKRALDLAHSQVNAPEYRKFIDDNTFVGAPLSKDETPKPVIKEESLIMLADKYYNWLISIPE